MIKSIILSSALFSLSACTWVELGQQGEQVIITQKEHIVNCRKTGAINVQGKHQLLGIHRNQTKVLHELETLARNEAARLSANTIVAETPVTAGQQRYSAYQCDR